MMDYFAYLEAVWHYFPYIFYAFVFLTFLPKSLGKIKSFADANYEANRWKYHRCYAPDICCHRLVDGDVMDSMVTKPKQRKAVTRVYPKRNASIDLGSTPTSPSMPSHKETHTSVIKTHTNVNQIARMFENGTAAASKKINRVTPTTILPEIRIPKALTAAHAQMSDDNNESSSMKRTPYAQLLLREDIENSVNLLNQQQQQSIASDANNHNWRSEPLPPLQRRNVRNLPTTLTYAGTSATPSTASPAASSPQSSPHSSPLSSPVLRHPPPLKIKSSLEDIFAAIAHSAENTNGNEQFIYAGCNTLAPVTSIDDILSQRRLSRPLSAYSISDLLNDENPVGLEETTYVQSFLCTFNPTETV